MSPTQKIAFAAGLLIFLTIGIAATVNGSASIPRAWGWAAGAGLLAYGLTAFGIGVAQGAAQAKRERQQGRK